MSGSSPPHAYCSYFDSRYLSRGVALIASLRGHGDDSPVWVMALDEGVKDYFDQAKLVGVHVIEVADLELVEPGLAAVKTQRSRMEYYFTCTPLLVRFVMNRYPNSPTTVIYLDSDLYFFDDPGLALDAMSDGSVGIIEHRYPPRLETRLARYGRFNVGWVGFASDTRGRACLDWWAESTLDWCYDVPKDGKYADQGYLNSFPEKFAGVSILQPRGLNLAPWNSERYAISAADNSRVRVEGDPLVFFHFHGIRRWGRWYVTSQFVYGASLGKILRSHVYIPYLQVLKSLDDAIGRRFPSTTATRGKGLRGLAFRAQRNILSLLAIASGSAIPARDLRDP